jgi:hypothetical protein
VPWALIKAPLPNVTQPSSFQQIDGPNAEYSTEAADSGGAREELAAVSTSTFSNRTAFLIDHGDQLR